MWCWSHILKIWRIIRNGSTSNNEHEIWILHINQKLYWLWKHAAWLTYQIAYKNFQYNHRKKCQRNGNSISMKKREPFDLRLYHINIVNAMPIQQRYSVTIMHVANERMHMKHLQMWRWHAELHAIKLHLSEWCIWFNIYAILMKALMTKSRCDSSNVFRGLVQW